MTWRAGRGMESEAAAADRGATDKAIAGLLFQGCLRRWEAAALRWADVQDAIDGRGPVLAFARLVDLVGALARPLAAGAGAVPGGVQPVGYLRAHERPARRCSMIAASVSCSP